MNTDDLVFMMLKSEPLEIFENLLKEEKTELEWDKLLDMCYCEERYESIGGDLGNEENPPINYERLAYLEKLIALLEQNGIEIEK